MTNIKKSETIKGFFITLSLGTVISFIGRLPFRFIPLIVLAGNDYKLFSLTLQTFALSIPIAGLNLHSPLTKEIRLNNSSMDIKIDFAISYWITNFIGFIFIFVMGVFYLIGFSIFQLLFLSATLIFRAFTEFIIANIRAHGYAAKSALISFIPAIIEGLIIIPFIFKIQIFLNLHFFIFLYCLGLISSFIIGVFLSDSSWKILFISLAKIRDKKRLLNAIRKIIKGFSLSMRRLFYSIGNWLIVYIAIQIMTINLFKIFDLSLFFISFASMISANIAISTLSVSNVEDKYQIKKNMGYLILAGIPMILLIIFIMEIIPLELLFNTFFSLHLSTEGKNIILIAVLLSFFLIITALLNGKIQSLGKYKEIIFSSFISFLAFLSFALLGFFMKSGMMLIIGLIIFNLIESCLFYYFIYIS